MLLEACSRMYSYSLAQLTMLGVSAAESLTPKHIIFPVFIKIKNFCVLTEGH